MYMDRRMNRYHIVSFGRAARACVGVDGIDSSDVVFDATQKDSGRIVCMPARPHPPMRRHYLNHPRCQHTHHVSRCQHSSLPPSHPTARFVVCLFVVDACLHRDTRIAMRVAIWSISLLYHTMIHVSHTISQAPISHCLS